MRERGSASQAHASQAMPSPIPRGFPTHNGLEARERGWLMDAALHALYPNPTFQKGEGASKTCSWVLGTL